LLSDTPDANKKETSKPSQKKETSAKTSSTPSGPRNSRLPPRDNTRNAQVDNTTTNNNSNANDNFSERRRGRYPRSDRNNGTRGTFNNRRQFDRHSGTGLVDSDKKSTQAWLGKDEATVVDGEIATNEAIKDKATEGEKVTEEKLAEQDEEDNVITLEDYLKQQAEKNITNDKTKKETRKANQGATIDVSQLREALPLEKSDEVYFAPNKSRKPKQQKQQKEKVLAKKVLVNIEQRFNEQESHRGRFTKNGPRQSGPRQNGGFRRQHNSNPVDINNPDHFPSLWF